MLETFHARFATPFAVLGIRTVGECLTDIQYLPKGAATLAPMNGFAERVCRQVERYLDRFHLYGKIKPGLTGLWQVSGRNDTTYDERIGYDAYYARNWSVWLDLHILARTAWVVVFGRGAY